MFPARDDALDDALDAAGDTPRRGTGDVPRLLGRERAPLAPRVPPFVALLARAEPLRFEPVDGALWLPPLRLGVVALRLGVKPREPALALEPARGVRGFGEVPRFEPDCDFGEVPRFERGGLESRSTERCCAESASEPLQSSER
eukprot:SAG11_NODE_1585_length_4639_cov_1.547357_4_plen_144_part_00